MIVVLGMSLYQIKQVGKVRLKLVSYYFITDCLITCYGNMCCYFNCSDSVKNNESINYIHLHLHTLHFIFDTNGLKSLVKIWTKF
jgi:hypothetical protein